MLKTRLSSSQALTQFRNTASKTTGTQIKAAAKKDVTANWITPAGGTPMSTAVFGAPSYNTLLTGIVPEYNEQFLLQYYRDMYYMDPIAGSAVDMSASFPFSDFTLAGLENKELDLFGENLSRINIRSLMQEISNAYLVDGAFVGTMIYNPEAKVFQDVMLHDVANASISPQPFHSLDPVVKMNSSAQLSQFMNAGSPYIERLMEYYPKALIDTYASGTAVLDPLTTIYIPRKALRDRTHVSYLKRLLPFYLFEKVMFRGTLVEAHKRQRSTSHITLGSESWIPSDGEIATILAEFQRTELDPLGAWIATRDGVQVNEIRCLAGNAKITTSKGPIQISKLVDHDPYAMAPGTEVPLKGVLAKNHLGEYAKVASWIFQGIKPTVRLKFSEGSHIDCTSNHKFVVLGADLKLSLKTAADLTNDDWIVKVPDSEVSINNQLNLAVPAIAHRKANANFTVPRVCTKELGYIIGLLLSEGNIGKSTVTVTNSDILVLNKYAACIESVFGLTPNIRKTREASSVVRSIRGAEVLFSDAVYVAETHTAVLVDALEQLGVRGSKKLKKENNGTSNSSAMFKEVPGCITAASDDVKISFLCAYLDGDGSVKVGRELSWKTTSSNIADVIHLMLGSLGVKARKTWMQHADGATGCFSIDTSTAGYSKFQLLSNGMSVHLSAKKTVTNVAANSHGIPGSVVANAIMSRDVSTRNQKVAGERGSMMLTDSGSFKFLVGGWRTAFRHFLKTSSSKSVNVTTFNYDTHATGGYMEQVQLLASISKKLKSRFDALMDLRYEFIRVVSKEPIGNQPVYDLHMAEDGPPTFCVSNIATRNSGGDFWKWTDIADQLVPMKLRGLGISEAFLSGDASYATAEAAITVFMENMEAYRQFITYKVFTSKFFPLIAVLNSQYKDAKNARKISSPSDIFYNLQNTRNLRIPSVQWHKSLTGKDEESTWDMLEKMSEKGFVIPLKMWAGAAGQDIATILRELKEDRRIREAIEDITGKKAESIGNSTEGEFDDASFDEAALQQGIQNEGGEGQEVPNPQETAHFMRARREVAELPIRTTDMHRRVPLLDRDFGNIPSDTRIGKTGKIHASFTPGRDARKTNDHIIKAMRALADPEYKARKTKEVREKMGMSANMGITPDQQDPRKTRRFSMD